MSTVKLPDHVIEGDGEITIFLLHGGYGSKAYWRNEMTYLISKGYRVVAWDTPGYGQSELPKNYSIELLAGECVRLIEDVGSERNVIIGHSMGGLIAPKVYEYRPSLVHAMVISATVASFGHMSTEFQNDFIKERVAPLDLGMTFAEVAEPLVSSMMYAGNICPRSCAYLRCRVKNARVLLLGLLSQQLLPIRVTGVIENLKVPSLFIAGRHDPIGTPELMSEMSARVAGSEFVCIEKRWALCLG